MNKSTKGAIAAGAAAVLLLGGAGSLAYWTAEANVAGDTISTGTLTLGSADCAAGWTIDGGAAFSSATDKLVPGDTLTRTCTMAVTASGKHLVADITTSGGTLPADSPFTIATSYQVKDAAGALQDRAQVLTGDKQVVATQKVTFDYGTTADNTSKDLSKALAAYAVTLKQVHN